MLSMAMVRDGFPFPSFVSAGATYFSGIRRAVSEEIADLKAKRMMLGVANGYERLAQRAEERAARLIPLK